MWQGTILLDLGSIITAAGIIFTCHQFSSKVTLSAYILIYHLYLQNYYVRLMCYSRVMYGDILKQSLTSVQPDLLLGIGISCTYLSVKQGHSVVVSISASLFPSLSVYQSHP